MLFTFSFFFYRLLHLEINVFSNTRIWILINFASATHVYIFTLSWLQILHHTCMQKHKKQNHRTNIETLNHPRNKNRTSKEEHVTTTTRSLPKPISELEARAIYIRKFPSFTQTNTWYIFKQYRLIKLQYYFSFKKYTVLFSC